MALNNLYNQEARLLNLYLFNVAFAMTSVYMSIIEYFKSKEIFLCLYKAKVTGVIFFLIDPPFLIIPSKLFISVNL